MKTDNKESKGKSLKPMIWLVSVMSALLIIGICLFVYGFITKYQALIGN